MISVITGSNGFSGIHLARYIYNHRLSDRIIGIDLGSQNKNEFLHDYYESSSINNLSCLIGNKNSEVRLFHLAGLLVNEQLMDLINTNLLWTTNLLQAAIAIPNLTCFLNVGSSAEYGQQISNILSEECPTNPITSYGISKHLQTQLVKMFARINKFPAICTRTFNLIGPGLSERFVCGKLVLQFANVKMGIQEKINIGRIDTSRDFIDIRDAVKIYWLLSEKGKKEEIYNVGTGRSTKISEIINMMSSYTGINAEVISEHGGQKEIDSQQADISKLLNINIDIKYIDTYSSMKDMYDRAISKNELCI